MEKVTFILPSKKVNPFWEEAKVIAKKTSLTIPLILKLLKVNRYAVEHALIDLEELSKSFEIKSKRGFFLHRYKKHLQ